ncbi:hypothetical protein [Alteromonas ponticola]|nr:hypothetical protein [Alteromonas ponticola]
MAQLSFLFQFWNGILAKLELIPSPLTFKTDGLMASVLIKF